MKKTKIINIIRFIWVLFIYIYTFTGYLYNNIILSSHIKTEGGRGLPWTEPRQHRPGNAEKEDPCLFLDFSTGSRLIDFSLGSQTVKTFPDGRPVHAIEALKEILTTRTVIGVLF